MNCRSCGAQLPPGAAHCPRCGAAVSYNDYNVGTAADAPTIASQSHAVAQQPPPTVYGPPLYGITPPTSYSTSPYNPYTPLPPAPPSPRRSNRIGVIVGIVLFLLILIGGSVLVFFLRSRSGQAPSPVSPTANANTTAQAIATATAVALQSPYTHSGTLALSDSLSDNSKGYDWDENTNCAFKGGAYHDIAPDPHFGDYCIAKATDFSNFAFEVQMQVIKGDAGGIVFRVTSTNPTNKYYILDVDQTGSYSFDVVNGSNDSTLAGGSSAAINQGVNQTNLLAVVAQGTSITLYVNHRPIAHVTDSTYSHGQVGLDANPIDNHPTEVVYSNVKVWTL